MNVFHKYTLKNLAKSKTRTLVTIIGIILSVSMFTATTESLASAQNYMLNYVKKTTGSFHLVYKGTTVDTAAEIEKSKDVKSVELMQNIGFADIGSKNEYKPYLYVSGINEGFADTVAVNMLSGRLPEKPNEIVISDHLRTNGGVEYKVGDKLKLKIGQRQLGSKSVDFFEPFKEGEKLSNTFSVTYTVVGICNRPSNLSENFEFPGYTAYTLADSTLKCPVTAYVTLDSPFKAKNFQEQNKSFGIPKRNEELMRCQFASDDNEIMILLCGFGAVLIILIMVASIALIYNSFSISVSERTRQFGLLKSIGATKKQMMNTVLFEAFFLSIIAVPLGILSGLGGIGVTFKCLSNTFDSVLAPEFGLKMTLCINPLALLAAAVISIITTLISAYIPARRAIKIAPIDAIRQSNDIKLKYRKVRSSPLTYKLFGVEGMLSSKNFKRNRKKYRITVLSLFVSIVLFISASSLCSYFTKAINLETSESNCDILVEIYSGVEAEEREKLFKELASVDGIKDYSVMETWSNFLINDKTSINKKYTQLYGFEGIYERFGLKIV